MKARVLPGKRIAAVAGVTLLYAAAVAFVEPSTWHFAPIGAAWAQESGHGSGGEGGSGGGGESGGGHGGGESGGESGGGHGGGEKGDGKGPRYHGARAGHVGHEAGVHGGQGRGGRGAEQEAIDEASGSTSHHFGGGSELGGLEQVPEGPGQNGYSYGAGPQYQLRYWGGWSIPDGGGTTPGEETTTVVTTTSEAPTSTGGGGGSGMGLSLSGPMRCEGVSGSMSTAQRISGRNLERINGVQAMIGDPRMKPDTVAPFLVANFQEELQKPSPNPTLAGAYLGIVAKQPVTPEMVQKVGATLCVSVSTPQADAIAAAAEDQRLNGRNTAQQGKR
ncbi:MAG TPA: hypothetical protein VNE59_07265 [Burkholderiales bacterium]|nr:hypothetical protein [Burkholderiales bacterium]